MIGAWRPRMRGSFETSPRMPLPLDPLRCALFVLVAFTLAGLAQLAWLRSPLSARWAVPLDGGARFLGEPLFGQNKTWRGLVVALPASAASFVLVFLAANAGGLGARLWPMSLPHCAAIGLA